MQKMFAKGTFQLSTTLTMAPGHLVVLNFSRPPLLPRATGPEDNPGSRIRKRGVQRFSCGERVRMVGEAGTPPTCCPPVPVTAKPQ